MRKRETLTERPTLGVEKEMFADKNESSICFQGKIRKEIFLILQNYSSTYVRENGASESGFWGKFVTSFRKAEINRCTILFEENFDLISIALILYSRLSFFFIQNPTLRE